MKYLKYIFALLAFGLVPQLFLATHAQAVASTVGTMVSKDGVVYMALETIKRPYTSPASFLSYSFNSWSNVVPSSTEDLVLTTGDFIPPRDGSIVCSDRAEDYGTCYLITDSKKSKFSSVEVLTQLGFSLDKSFKGDVSFMVSAPDITSGEEAHRVGIVINKNNSLYLIGKNGLIGMPTETILNSWGYKTSDALTANAKDLELPYRFSAEARRSNELRPFEPVIPTPLLLENKDKFSIPFEGPEFPVLTESWLYSSAERSVHGFVNHGGVDLAQPRDTPVYAAADGYAISSTHISPLNKTYNNKTPVGFGLGEFVQIWHPEQGVYTSYSHLSKVSSEIPYFKPTCKDGFCDPEVVYNDSDYSVKKGKLVKRGDLIGYVGDSGLSLGYKEKPRAKRADIKKNPSWDETHLHFEMYTRVAPNFTKARRYDPFGIYGRLDQYSEASYVGPNSLWKMDESGKVEFAR